MPVVTQSHGGSGVDSKKAPATGYVAPWASAPIWQPFKWTTGNPAAHSGIDLGMPVGTPITAPVNGTIISTGMEPWGGQVNEQVVINGHKYVLTWIHLSSVQNLRPGEQVEAGTVLGHSGVPPAGYGSGAHTHFEVTNGTTPPYMGYNPQHPTSSSYPINPAPFLLLFGSGAIRSAAAGAVTGGAASGSNPSGCVHTISLFPGNTTCLDPALDLGVRAVIVGLALALLVMGVAVFAAGDKNVQQAVQTAGSTAATGAKRAAEVAALAA